MATSKRVTKSQAKSRATLNRAPQKLSAARKSTRKSSSESAGTPWFKCLDQEQIRAACDEATVDAYNDYEKHTGLLTALGDALQFPFSARVLGENVSVVGMEWPENDEFGLDLVVERNGERHRIEARSIQLLRPYPEGHVFLAAYLDWKSRF